MMSLKKLAIYIPVVAVCLYVTKWYFNGGWCYSTVRVDGKVVIITGANTGIGKETALDLAKRGGKIIMACRSLERGNQAADDIIKLSGVTREKVKVMKLDLGSLKSVRQFVQDFKKSESRLDILINNAGVMWGPYTKTEDGFEETLGVNHLGHFLLTNLLLDMLKSSAPSRVVTVSSNGHAFGAYINFDDLQSEKSYSRIGIYGQSKLANILFTRELARQLEGTGVTTYSLHPGAIKTELGRHIPFQDFLGPPLYYIILQWILKDVDYGAQTTICCALDPDLAKVTGKYYSDCREKQPSAAAQDDETAKKLWSVSSKLVGLTNQ